MKLFFKFVIMIFLIINLSFCKSNDSHIIASCGWSEEGWVSRDFGNVDKDKPWDYFYMRRVGRIYP